MIKQSWKDYGDAAGKSPLSIIIKIIVLLIVVGVISYFISGAAETGKVVRDEFGPKAMLKKYEWFKNTSASLDEKIATVKVYETRTKGMVDMYEDTPRKDWDRVDKEQYNLYQSEVAGVKASYNALASEYNAQMTKFNWKFTNKGDLPKGASEPLPRDYKTYIVE